VARPILGIAAVFGGGSFGKNHCAAGGGYCWRAPLRIKESGNLRATAVIISSAAGRGQVSFFAGGNPDVLVPPCVGWHSGKP